jgi:hypothetical protein
MSALEELGPLQPLALEVGLFDYVPLDSPRAPPPVRLHARLARRYEADEGDEPGGERLRLAFVAGRPIDSHDLLVLSYVWREPPRGVVWGFERWPSPERRLRLYRRDAAFEPRRAPDVHAELQGLGPASFTDQARDLLAR